MIIKCVAVDDEPIALSIIESFCNRYSGLDLVTFTDPKAALVYIEQALPDLVFLDIEMNDISGISLAKLLPSSCLLVFTTAYSNYALEGFELNAVDFLHKPFSYSRFEKAITKIARIINAKQLVSQSQSEEQILLLKVEYKNVKVSLSEILYIEAMDNYVKVFKTDGSCVISQINLKHILELLPIEQFARIHRSYVVSIAKVVGFTKRQVTVGRNEVSIPIGRIYSSDVYTLFSDRFSQ